MTVTAAEETPLLLSDPAVLEHEAVYRRFSPVQKRWIVALISLCGILPFFVSGTFIPSIPEIAKELDSTGAIINLAVSLSVLVNAFGCLLWATYSTFYGRRPIYLLSLLCQCIGSLGVACSRSVPELLATRIVQAFGSSSGLSIGIAVIGDLYKLEERGTAAGIFFGCTLLGPTLAPIAGGFTAEYYSWRIMQLALFVSAVLILIAFALFMPETAHPGTKGVDGVQAGKPTWVWLNPVKSLALLRSPNVTIVALAGGLLLMTDYAMLVPVAYTMGKRYNIDNAAIIGALFIPTGLGNLMGSPISGKLSDMVLIRMRRRRGGVWVPEDRLLLTLVGASVMAPVSVLLSGIFITYVDGNLGIALNLAAFFLNGVGVDFILGPATAYAVDILHSRSAEVSAASMAVRGLLIAACTSFILPMINTFGVLTTYTITAFIGWFGCFLLWSVIAYGDRMRAYVDVGYSTIRDN
ncbi:MFS general substrate transporter [Cristinia sonorae]|uniref:MFS general substrate transporter n=1 Tax=Cristinia sonorae TaxID=1940300 RepID=A0A8K0XPN6_9AGAR|nr:MFS general substrate transporter [Cristinia sonorae]